MSSNSGKLKLEGEILSDGFTIQIFLSQKFTFPNFFNVGNYYG